MLVREFLERAKNGEIDYADFYEKFYSHVKELQREYEFFITIADFAYFTNTKRSPPLYGLPISAKDNLCTKGLQTTAGSLILKGYLPPFDATCIAKVREAGGAIIGKTAMDEFGFGTFTTNCAYAKPKNPIDPSRSCGGSSGGAAGFVAACKYPTIALAESTGGSISCPASFCGVVGLTPTYGLVSRWGLIDYACSLDKIGCIGKCVYDVALLLSIIAGHDPRDQTTLKVEQRDYTVFTRRKPKHIKTAIPKEYLENVDQRVERAFWRAVKQAEGEGMLSYDLVALPSTKYALTSYYLIATAEASTNLAKFCGMRYGYSLELEEDFNSYFSRVRGEAFGSEAKRRIILGTFARVRGYRERYYLKALKVRRKIIEEFKHVLMRFDCILAPTMPILPPKFSEIEELSPIEAYQCDVLTVPVNLAGLPHISLPCGSAVDDGTSLPVGMHVICDHLKEGKLISIAAKLESCFGVWHEKTRD